MNLRALSDYILSQTLENTDLYGATIYLTYTDGSQQTVTGQVVYHTLNADQVYCNKPSITLRLSSLDKTLDNSVELFVRIPKAPTEGAEYISYTAEKPFKFNRTLGIVTIYLTSVDQSVEEDPIGD